MSEAGKVCCSYCGTDAGVRTYSCPFKYCELTAMCPACAADRPELRTRVGHRSKGCESAASAARTAQAERSRASLSGTPLLASSTKVGHGLVHAIFRAGGDKFGKFMPEAVYARCAAAGTPTLQHCEAVAGGALPDAPDDFDSGLLADMLEAAREQLGANSPPAQPPAQTGGTTTLFAL